MGGSQTKVRGDVLQNQKAHEARMAGTAWEQACTDLGLRAVHRLLLEGHALRQHGAIVLVADVLIGVVQASGAWSGWGSKTGRCHKLLWTKDTPRGWDSEAAVWPCSYGARRNTSQ